MEVGSKRFFFVIAITLVACLCPAIALADSGHDLVAGNALLETQADDDIASGESGTCTWRIDSTGNLIVSPSSGEVGELESWGYDYNEGVFTTPWCMYRAEITSARFEGEVKVADCRGMFMNCTSLASIDLSGLSTSSIENMQQMFSGCSSLTSINLSSLDTSNVVGMTEMFKNCSSLTSLDLSSFKTEKLLTLLGMFLNCSSLETVYVGDGWTYGTGGKDPDFYIHNSENMFYGCTSLVGGNGTKYGVGSNYKLARIDSPGAPGYFTLASVNDPKAEIVLPASTYTYDGSPIVPVPTVILAGRTLLAGKDYEVSYSDNVDAGTATVTVTGVGNYAGIASGTFTIDKATISIPAAVTGLVYTGDTQVGVPEGDYYTVEGGSAIDAGSHTATVSPDSNHRFVGGEESILIEWSIDKAAIAVPVASDITITGLVYNGAVQTGVPAGDGYTVDGGSATDAGSYTATVSPDSNHRFAGGEESVPVEWSIGKAVIAIPEAVTGLVYNGAVQTGVPEGDGYEVVGGSAVEAGSHIATVTADANHQFPGGVETAEVEWAIDAAVGWLSIEGKWYYFDSDGSLATNAWREGPGGWHYLGPDGSMVVNKWVSDPKGWCYVGSDGYMVTSKWQKDSKGWCFLDSTGHAVKDSWKKVGGEWYYFDSAGHMVTNKWAKDSKGWCYLGSDGRMVANAWVEDSEGWCYVDSDGHAVVSAWKQIRSTWYYFDSAGRMATSKWIKDSKGWSYVGVDGVRANGAWVEDSKGLCYVGSDGYMVTSTWKQIGGKWFYFDSSGHMVTDKWQKDSKGWCYLGSNGYMVTNKWVKDSKGWCYVGSDGYMVTSKWQKDSKGWCFLDSTGHAVKDSWKKIGGEWYYFDSAGHMVVDMWATDSKGVCRLGSDGKMVTDCWFTEDGEDYYVDSTGHLAINSWREINGRWYYFDSEFRKVHDRWMELPDGWVYLGSSGAVVRNAWISNNNGRAYVGSDGFAYQNQWMRVQEGWIYFGGDCWQVYGWKQISGKWYYFDRDGLMVTGTHNIDGRYYTFDINGAWVG